MNLARIHKPSKDEQHEAKILACYERWLEGKAKWSEFAGLLAQRSKAQVARMEAERGIG